MLDKNVIRVDSEASETISQLPLFTDIYIHCETPVEQSFIWPGPEKLPEELHELAQHIKDVGVNAVHKDFRVSYHGHGFRGHKMTTLGGTYYVCRRMPTDIWTLEDCKINSVIRKELLSSRINRGGLVIIAGKPGNGKSTTVAAMLSERLNKYGGMCLTIEDPAEMPLHGIWGEGVCLQREVPYEEFPEAIRDAMRAYPTGVNTSMLIGEVRDPETAALALQSAVDGRLVVCTMHAGSVIQAVHRILTLASAKLGAVEAHHLLASSFRYIMHQQLQKGRLIINILMDTPSVVGKILVQEPVEQLKNDQRLQMQSLKLNKPIELRKID